MSDPLISRVGVVNDYGNGLWMEFHSDLLQAGSGGKWQTPHQKAKAAATSHRGGGKIEPGDEGIWATCVKGKEGAATEELKGLFEEVRPPFLETDNLMLHGLLTPDSMQNVSMESSPRRSNQRRRMAKWLT